MPQHEDRHEGQKAQALRNVEARLARTLESTAEQLRLVRLELAEEHVGRDGFRQRLTDAVYRASETRRDWRTEALDLLAWLGDHVRDGKATAGGEEVA